MKKVYILIALFTMISVSCKKDFGDLNTDPKHPTDVPGETLFSNAVKVLVDQESTPSVNLNVWRLFSQYLTTTTYTDETNYDIVNRTIPDNTFNVYYRNILSDLKEAKRIIELKPDGGLSPKVKTNKLHIIELMNAYTYGKMVDIFGNIPYSEALNIDILQPKYDDAYEIYKDLIVKIDASIAGLDAAQGSFGSADLIYGGNVGKWIKFANSLKLKLGIHLSDVPEASAIAKAAIESAAPNVFSSSADDAKLNYLGAQPNTNPLYAEIVVTGRKDFVAANTIIDIMVGLADPRLDNFFTTKPDTNIYVGGQYGYLNSYGSFSHISDNVLSATFPGVLMDFTEIQFYLAEASEKGYAVGGAAAGYYDAAITASIIDWGGTSAEAVSYLAKPEVNYVTATGTYKQKIGTQSWIAFYNRGLEGFTQWRRLDFPILNIAKDITNYSEIPKRFTYPIKEQTLNNSNYTSASAAIGGDLLTTKLFWDKF